MDNQPPTPPDRAQDHSSDEASALGMREAGATQPTPPSQAQPHGYTQTAAPLPNPPPGASPYAPPGQPTPQGYATPSQSTPSTEKRGVPTWGKVAIGVTLLLVAACVVVAFLTMNAIVSLGSRMSEASPRIGSWIATDYDAKGTVANFYEGLQDSDFVFANLQLTNELGEQYTEGVLSDQWGALASGGDVNYTIKDVREQGNDAEVAVTLEDGSGRSYETKLTLSKDAGFWEISGGDPWLIPEP